MSSYPQGLASGDRAETSIIGLVLTAGTALFEPVLGAANWDSRHHRVATLLPGTRDHPASDRRRCGVPSASEQAQRVKILNANWVPGTDGGDGRFEIMIVHGR